MDKKLLIECSLFNVNKQLIQENKDTGQFIVKGIIAKADTLNQNGRVYPKNVLQKQIKQYKLKIEQNQALGQLDHPDSSTIRLQRVSHNILDVWWQDNNIWGKIKILGTPHGNILKQLFKQGINVGISSRGLGSVVKQQNKNVVQDDYEIICWDFVSNPSTPGAYMSRLNQNKTIQCDNNLDIIIDKILNNLK